VPRCHRRLSQSRPEGGSGRSCYPGAHGVTDDDDDDDDDDGGGARSGRERGRRERKTDGEAEAGAEAAGRSAEVHGGGGGGGGGAGVTGWAVFCLHAVQRASLHFRKHSKYKTYAATVQVSSCFL